MFHSAALKLTMWYLAIILGLSLAFSLTIFQLSRNELIRNNNRQNIYLNDRSILRFYNFKQLMQRDLDDSLHRLKVNLVLFNVLVLVAGGAASYALARRTLEPIEQTLEAQKRFTGDASHELRTPLTVMQTENEVSLRNPNLTKQQAIAQLKSNLEEVAKLKSLSDGLLKLASSDSSSLVKTVVPLEPLAKTVLKRWVKIAKQKNVKFKNNIENVAALGDSESISELLSILIDNSIKYGPDNTTVTISIKQAGKYIKLSVQDQGIGIKKSELPKIFDRFYQTDSSHNSLGGYGLGLSIAQRIAELHNGSIEVTSTLNKGSTFTVSLPAA